MADFYFKDAFGVPYLSNAAGPFYFRDADGNLVLSNSTFPVIDAYGNKVLSSANPLWVIDTDGNVVNSATTAPTVRDTFGNRVASNTGVVRVGINNYVPTGASAVGPAPITQIYADGKRALYGSLPPRTYLTTQDGTSTDPFLMSQQGFDTNGDVTFWPAQNFVTKRLRDGFSPTGNYIDGDNGNAGFVYSTDDVMLASTVFRNDTITAIPVVTNNSTVIVPPPLCWFTSVDQVIIGDSVTVDVVAMHPFPNPVSGNPVACVEFIWSDDNFVTTRTLKVSTMTQSDYAGQERAFPLYRGVLNTAGMDAGVNGKIKVNAKVYPWIGGDSAANGGGISSIADSATNTTDRGVFRQQIYEKNNTRAATPFLAVVNPGAAFGAFGAGNDGTGVTSVDPAVARATPFATIEGAMVRLAANHTNMGGCEILLAADVTVTTPLTNTTTSRPMTIAGPVIRPDPTINRANARITNFSGGSRVGQTGLDADSPSAVIHFRGLDITIVGQISSFAPSGLFCVWDDCTIDHGARTTSMYASSARGGLYRGSRKLNGSGSAYTGSSGHGCYNVGSVFNPLTAGCALSNRINIGNTINRQASANFANGVSDGQMHYYSKWVRDLSGATILSTNGENIVRGIGVVSCELERFQYLASNPNILMSADAPAVGNVGNLFILNSAIIGTDASGRGNIAYDENAATPQCEFTASCSGNTLTVTAIISGTLANGQTMCRRTGVTPVVEEAVLSGGPGGIGNYTISGPPQNFGARTCRTATAVDTAGKQHGLIVFKGNVFEVRTAAKYDFVCGSNPYDVALTIAQCAARQGSRAYSHGVDFADNVFAFRNNFQKDYHGTNTAAPPLSLTNWSQTGFAGANRITAPAQYTNWQAPTETAAAPANGVGGGIYSLVSPHPGINRCGSNFYTPRDITGAVRIANTNNSSGAYR